MKRRNIIFIVSLFFILIIASAIPAFAAVDEQEPNDTKQTANTISVGTAVYCSSDSDSADWFKFTAPISGTAKISIKKDSDYSGVSWGLDAAAEVTDSNSNELAYAYDDFSTDGATTSTFGVVAGRTYYVRCWGDNCGFYQNGIDYHFKIGYYIGKTSISKVKGKKKAFTVKWNRKAGSSYYQLQYVRKSTYRDYGWTRAKIINISSNSKTIRNLAKNKKYYVRVRTIRSICGITYYSGWSTSKCVRTK